MTLTTILALLPKVGPAIAAIPEFKRLVEEVVVSLGSEREQAELQHAYELAVKGAAEAHSELQAIVARYS